MNASQRMVLAAAVVFGIAGTASAQCLEGDDECNLVDVASPTEIHGLRYGPGGTNTENGADTLILSGDRILNGQIVPAGQIRIGTEDDGGTGGVMSFWIRNSNGAMKKIATIREDGVGQLHQLYRFAPVPSALGPICGLRVVKYGNEPDDWGYDHVFCRSNLSPALQHALGIAVSILN